MVNELGSFFEVYCAVFQGFCLQYFLGNFLEYRGRKRNLKEVSVTVLYTALILCVNALMSLEYDDIRVIQDQVATFCIIMFLTLAFYRSVRAITGYLVIAFMAVDQVSYFVAHSVFQVGNGLYRVWIWCIEKGYITDTDQIAVILDATAAGLQLLMCGVFSVLCFYSLKSIVHSFREKDQPISRTGLYFLLTSAMAGLFVCVLLRIIVAVVENGVPNLLYDSHPILLLVTPAILILCLLTILYSVKLFQRMIELNRAESSRIILEKQVEGMQGQIAEIEHIYSGIRGMRHDMGTTLAVITQLAEEGGGSAKLQDYLSELNQSFDRLEMRYKTGNAVVDTLLGIKYHEMTRTVPGVTLYADRILFPEKLAVQSYDIGVIIGNALDNAVEACRKLEGSGRDLFIRIISYQKKGMLFIKMENSFDGKVTVKKGAEFPTTSKQDKKTHGIGLANIKNVAEKYDGGVDWQAEDGVFTLLVMLQNRKAVSADGVK